MSRRRSPCTVSVACWPDARLSYGRRTPPLFLARSETPRAQQSPRFVSFSPPPPSQALFARILYSLFILFMHGHVCVRNRVSAEGKFQQVARAANQHQPCPSFLHLPIEFLVVNYFARLQYVLFFHWSFLFSPGNRQPASLSLQRCQLIVKICRKLLGQLL